MIGGPAVVLTGSSVTYSLNATAAGGRLRPTTWNTDNAAVAAIRSGADGIGELTAHARGTATIVALYAGSTTTYSIVVRDAGEQTSGANLVMSFEPEIVTSLPTPCSGFPLPPPAWRFTETITETRGVGFKVGMATIGLYRENGNEIYLSTDPEDYYFAANSSFVEESCVSLFGSPSGIYVDGLHGVDDLGNKLSFASQRLRLLAQPGASSMSTPLFVLPRGTITHTLRRTR